MNDERLDGSRDAASLGLWRLVGLGAVFVGNVVAGLVLGWLADRHFDSSPVFVLSGIGIGIIGAFVSAWQQIKPFLDR
jgi:F0F1-type ATP synthase assembly protein I